VSDPGRAATSTDDDPLELDGRSHHLDPRVRVVWAIGSGVPVLVAGLVGAIVAQWQGWTGVAVGVAVGAVLYMAALLVWVRLAWDRWTWAAWSDALEVRHGVITRRASLVPYHRIQQIDLHRGPLERFLGLARLVLRTASATTDAEIPGIPLARAESLRPRLLARAGVDDAV
jgi:uncharacterized protein